MRSPHVLACAVADELVLYSSDTHAAVALNLTATAVWELCDGFLCPTGIAATLADATGTEADALLPDVERVVAELAELGAVTFEDDPCAPAPPATTS